MNRRNNQTRWRWTQSWRPTKRIVASSYDSESTVTYSNSSSRSKETHQSRIDQTFVNSFAGSLQAKENPSFQFCLTRLARNRSDRVACSFLPTHYPPSAQTTQLSPPPPTPLPPLARPSTFSRSHPFASLTNPFRNTPSVLPPTLSLKSRQLSNQPIPSSFQITITATRSFPKEPQSKPSTRTRLQ